MKTKIETRIFPFILILMLLILLDSCKKDEKADLPDLTTNNASNITATTASCGGNITNDGDADITARGVCWSTSQKPTVADSKSTDGKGTGSFSSNISGLTSNTNYYLRAYATNSAGTGYGNEVIIKTSSATVTDIDGNIYNTVTIGTQVWMVENLKTTKYRDGTNIPIVTDNTAWSNLSTGAYSDYNNDASNSAIYGRIYNWYAATNSRYISPTGWHVPTDTDWMTLITYFGGESTAGGALKESGLTHWNSPNAGATNESGFTALPGGYRFFDGSFKNLGGFGYWWTSSTGGPSLAWYRYMTNNSSSIYRTSDYMMNGLRIRCVKD